MNRKIKTRVYETAAPNRLRHQPMAAHQTAPEPELQSIAFPHDDDDSNGLNLVDIVRILMRHKKKLILPTLFITAMVYTMLQFVAPRYTAQTRLLIEGTSPSPTVMAPVSAGLQTDDDTTAFSEQHIFTSHDLLSLVIDELSLDEREEFNPTLSDDETIQTELTEEQLRSLVVSQVAKKVDIATEPDSRVITIQATATDPQLSSSIANTIVEKYLKQQIEVKMSTAGRVDDWLVNRIEELRKDVSKAEKDVEDYRQSSGLKQPGVSLLISEEISELSTQLLRARNDRITATARTSSATNVLESSLINSLKNSEAALKGEISGLAGKYGALHPVMVRTQAELERVQQDIRTESNKITRNDANEVRVARQREDRLENDLANLKQRLSEAKLKEIGLKELEQEVSTSQDLLATFLSRQKEVQLQNDEGIQRADARVISYAGVPFKKSFPQVLPITALASVAALFLSMLAVFVAEQFSAGFNSLSHITRATGLPILGVIPKQKNAKTVAELANGLKDSSFGESFRALQVQMGIYKSRNQGRREGKAYLVTSMYPGEGKTSVACCLAMSLRRSGDRVLVIDGDLRKPSLHKIFEVDDAKGIRSKDWENLSFSGLVQQAGHESVHNPIDVIPANSTGLLHPHDVLCSPLFTQLIAHAKRHYDVIIIDSPPLRAVDDAVVISRAVDSTLFVMPWEHASRKVISSGLERLDRDSLAGIVLTKVDVHVHNQLAYGDSRRYKKALNEYNRQLA